jgi:hypothetical protein
MVLQMVLFDQPHLKIEYRSAPCRYLLSTWTGTVLSKDYKEGVQRVLQCCRENGIDKLVTDTRRQDILSLEDRRFAEQAIQRHLRDHGRFYQAVIVPSDVFLTFGTDEFSHRTHLFANDFEAVEWLKGLEDG